MTLKDIKVGESAQVTVVGGEGALRQHFLDMGVIPGARIKVVKYAPMGDPIELRIHGYELCHQEEHPCTRAQYWPDTVWSKCTWV